MARMNIPAPEEALAGMARIGAPRQPMGNQAYTLNSVPGTGRATLMPRRNTQAGDPYGMGTKQNRVYGSLDRNGARHGVSVSYAAPISIEAAATQANGRIIPCCVPRDRVNFDLGAMVSG